MMRCARYQLLIVAAVLLIPAFAAAASPQRSEAEIRQRLKQVFARPEFSLQDMTFWEWLRQLVSGHDHISPPRPRHQSANLQSTRSVRHSEEPLRPLTHHALIAQEQVDLSRAVL